MKTYRGTARLFAKVLENGELRVRPRTLKEIAAQLVVIRLGHMPTGRKAPEMTIPCGQPAAAVAGEVRAQFVRMATLQAEVAGRFGDRRIGQHPMLGALTAAEWAKFHWVHSRHHFRQIDALLSASLYSDG